MSSSLSENVAGVLDELPAHARALGQLTRDNPGPVALLAASSIITQKILLNLVRPRGALEAAACLVAGPALAGIIAEQMMRRGIVRVRVRDAHGCLVPLEFPGMQATLNFCDVRACPGKLPGGCHDDCADPAG